MGRPPLPWEGAGGGRGGGPAPPPWEGAGGGRTGRWTAPRVRVREGYLPFTAKKKEGYGRTRAGQAWPVVMCLITAGSWMKPAVMVGDFITAGSCYQPAVMKHHRRFVSNRW